MRISLASALAALIVGASTAQLSAQVTPRVYSPRESDAAPQIDLWLDQISYRVGDRVAPHFVAEVGAYVTIVRVSSDGQLRVLYPARPRDQKAYTPAQLVNDRVPYSSLDRRFDVLESRGIGFVFAIASFDKFNFGYYTSANDWSSVRLDNDSRYGDPFEIVRRFVDRTLADGSDFSMDYVSYDVSNDGTRSRYASRYGFSTVDDFYDSCITAFGLRYTPYCSGRYIPGYYPGYYPGSYPIIVSQPQAPRTNVPRNGNYAGKHIRPVTGDPIVDGSVPRPEPAAEGRLPERDAAAEAALAGRRARLPRDVTPRDRTPTNADTRPIEREPRVYTAPERPRDEPRVFTAPERPRAEPRPESRMEPRSEPRPEIRMEPRSQPSPPPAPPPPPPARVEVRSEPAPAPVIHPASPPSPAPAPVKDN